MIFYVRDLAINEWVLISLRVVEVISHGYQATAVELFTITLRIGTSDKFITGE